MNPFKLTEEAYLDSVGEYVTGLTQGIGVNVVPRGKENFYQVEKLNRVIMPRIAVGSALIVNKDLQERGLLDKTKAITSVETSGPKYAQPLSITLDIPYFSIHLGRRGNLVEPVSEPYYSTSRNELSEIVVDKEIVRRYGPDVVVFDEITRGFGALAAAYNLLKKAEANILAAYSFFLWDFVDHPHKEQFPQEIFHPLFVVKGISSEGKFDFNPNSLAFKYIRRR